MTDSTTPNLEPGWYPDPWRAAELRYFDGVAWTQHTNGGGSATATSSTMTPEGAGRGAIPYPTTATLGRAAMVMLAIYQVANIGVSLLTGSLLTDFYHQLLNHTPGEPVPAAPASASIINLISLPSLMLALAGLTCIIIWSFRVAKNGSVAGIAAPLRPGWAIGGWFIPFANYVLPYLSIAGALPANRRRQVLVWWLFFIAPLLLTIPISIVMFVGFLSGNSQPVIITGFIALGLGTICAVMQVVLGYRVTAELEQTHTATAGGHGF